MQNTSIYSPLAKKSKVELNILNPLIPFPQRLPLVLKWKFSLKALWIITLISITALLIFYIFQVNFLTKETYLIQNHEKKLNQLSLENENLEINFSKLNSLENIEKYIQSQNFEKISKVKYIRVLEGTVVTK